MGLKARWQNRYIISNTPPFSKGKKQTLVEVFSNRDKGWRGGSKGTDGGPHQYPVGPLYIALALALPFAMTAPIQWRRAASKSH